MWIMRRRGGESFWRKRMCERLDLDPAATWDEVELALIAVRGRAAVAERDHAEMLAFVRAAELFWWEQGTRGRPAPEAPG